MDPGDYLTNVLTSQNFTSIEYKFYEPSLVTPITTLQNIAVAWRQKGALVFCDSSREGIWIFKACANASAEPRGNEIAIAEPSRLVEEKGVALAVKQKGVYDPASLAINTTTSNGANLQNNYASPSSSQEYGSRSSQISNLRASQSSSFHGQSNETPIPSPGKRHLNIIHECFIAAVLDTLVFFLCRDDGFIPINSRTLVFAPSNIISGSSSRKWLGIGYGLAVATLDISLTSLGSLVVKIHSEIAPGLQDALGISNQLPSKLISGSPLWLAPGGKPARLYDIQVNKSISGNLPISPVKSNVSKQLRSSIADDSVAAWRSKCLQWLSAKGLDASKLDEGGWISVQMLRGSSMPVNYDAQSAVSDELAVVPWPALLCFQTPSPTEFDSTPIKYSASGPRDALSFAEEWFGAKDERAHTVAKIQKEKQLAEASAREQAENEARTLQPQLYSPMALRRGSNTGVNAGAMYPTPPDALHHQVGTTPTFDGTASTPGNLNQPVPQDADHTILAINPVTEADELIWGTSMRKERSDANVPFAEHDNDNPNLFGDLEGDLFGDTAEITDADFSFFDEPDLIENDEQPDFSVVEIANEDLNTLNMANSFTDLDENLILDESRAVVLETKASAESLDDKLYLESGLNEMKPVTEAEPKSAKKAPASPPFNKEFVFKKIIQKPSAMNQHKRASAFDKVDLEASLASFDMKYGASGRFKFPGESTSRQPINSFDLPKTGYLARRQKSQGTRRDAQALTRLLDSKPTIEGLEADDVDEMDYQMDSDETSQVSEPDDSSLSADDHYGLSEKTSKRPINDYTDDLNPSNSSNSLAIEYEASVSTPHSMSGPQLPLLEPDPAEWSLSAYLTLPELDRQSNSLSDSEYIAAAQILADQTLSETFVLPGSFAPNNGSDLKALAITRKLVHRLSKAASFCFEEVKTCTLRTYIDIQGISALNQTLRLPPRPGPLPRTLTDMNKQNNPFQIPSPQLEVRRSDNKLSVLPSAISFWENLGLGPSEGIKDIHCICLYPKFDNTVLGGASIFLDQLRSVYESCRLGNHEKIVCKEIQDGLFPYTINQAEPTNRPQQLAHLKETASNLSRVLASLPVEEKNFVIYFIYPVDNATLLVQICAAFNHLFNQYRKFLSDRKAKFSNELVLQLIPMNFVSSPTALAVPSSSDYIRLAMEVYDRCVNFRTFSSSPAVLLEQPFPKNIEFKLTLNPSASVLHENSVLHIGYAQSIDDRWITASWSDNRGNKQMTASYCLGRKHERISMPFSEIAREIWETSTDLMSGKKIRWRLMVAKAGVMTLSEIECWTRLASRDLESQVSLTLVTVQTNSSLRLVPAPLIPPMSTSATHPFTTPVSTPQPSQSAVISPENTTTPTRESIVNAATPNDNPTELDIDARLVDITEQSWGVILAHRLNNSNSLLETNLALVSGYLIKRGGANSDSPPIVLEVNIVYSEMLGNPRTFHEGLLREILGYYRNLGTLARVRGVVDPVRDVRPWHIATVEKAVKALYILM